jgi:N-methylhydantoinase A
VKEEIQSYLSIGVDIGGTFTDFVIYDRKAGELSTSKLLSTPSNPAKAVLEGIQAILDSDSGNDPNQASRVVITHGSTVATNALLERKGARTALVTTKGFRDVLQIGRQDRPELYDLAVQPHQPLVPRSLRFEVDERIDNQGEILKKLDAIDINNLLTRIESEPVESIAVCLLFSFLHPEHEQMIARELRKLDLFVSISSEILPEYREYERTSTTVINAYVTPILDRYLGYLDNSLPEGKSRLRVMQSNGGIIGLSEARQAGVRCILSGPAGGVVGACRVAQAAQNLFDPEIPNQKESNSNLRMITFDMGGTSTDVSLVESVPAVTTETEIGGYPIRIPVLDIHTIGAGGGSIASVDLGGALRVGPESAGADPGPACYARRDDVDDLPTVTDANVVLGRLPSDHFLGGKMKLDYDRAHFALKQIGGKIGLNALQTARGVIDVVNAHMERALRLVSIERGYDPREFSLLSFGGAGGLHACDLAEQLGIPKVIVPPLASTLSAYGMLVADVIKDYSQTIMTSGEAPKERILADLHALVEQGKRDIQNEGFSPDQILIERALDMRYRGQSYELTIPFSEHYLEEFHRYHERAYGYARRASTVEIVNVRLRAIGLIEPPPLPDYPSRDRNPAQAYLEDRQIFINDGMRNVPMYQGELLSPGNQISGPAIIVRKDTTIYLSENKTIFVDHFSNLIITIA